MRSNYLTLSGIPKCNKNKSVNSEDKLQHLVRKLNITQGNR